MPNFFSKIGKALGGVARSIFGFGGSSSCAPPPVPAAPRADPNAIEINRINAELKKRELEHADKLKAREIENLARERAYQLELQKIAAAKHAKSQEFELQRERERLRVQENQLRLKQQERQASLTQVQAHIGDIDSKIADDAELLVKEKAAFTGFDKQYQIVLQWNEEYKDGKYDIDSTAKDEAFQKFAHHNSHVQAAVDAVGTVEEDVGKVLCLTHNWFEPIMSTTINANNLYIKMKTFGDIVKRECQNNLTTEQFFNCNGLSRLVPVCEQEHMEHMNVLHCHNQVELEELMSTLDKGLGRLQLEQEQEKKEQKGDEEDDEGKETEYKTEHKDQEDLEEAAEEIDRQEQAKALLQKWGLSKYWDNMKDTGYDWVDEWQDLIDHEGLLENCGFSAGHTSRFKRQYLKWKLKEATTLYKHLSSHEQRLLQTVCMNRDSYAALQQEQTEATKEGLGAISGLLGDFFRQLQIGATQAQEVLAKQLQNGLITDMQSLKAVQYQPQVNNNNNNGNDMNGPDGNIMRQSQALAREVETTVISINVTDMMMERFTQDEMSAKALQIAVAVEDCYKQVLGSQTGIRRSVAQAMRITRHKPPQLSEKSEPLWNAVCDGVEQVCGLTIQMEQIAARYTSYFLKFQQAFTHYVENQHRSFEISLKNLHGYLNEFEAFTKEVTNQVDCVNKRSMDCIRNCVHKSIGAINFDRHCEAREMARTAYLEEKRKYDAKVLELENLYNEKQQHRITLAADRAACEYKISMLSQRIKDNKAFKQQYMNIQSSLMQAN